MEHPHFIVLLGLFLLSILMHHTESWDSPERALYSMLFATLFLVAEKRRKVLFVVGILPLALSYVDRFPNLANHSNLSLFLIAVLWPFTVLHLRRDSSTRYQDLIKTLRLTAFFVYFFAAFHKCNSDFFDPAVSCANDKLKDYYELFPWFLSSYLSSIKALMPFVAFSVEVFVPLALAIPKLRSIGIIFQVVVHCILAPVGFVDFSALGLVFTWAYVEPSKLSSTNAISNFRRLGLLLVILAAALGFFRWDPQRAVYGSLEGVVFSLVSLLFLVRVVLPALSLSPLAAPKGFIWRLSLVILVLFGASNYLGLRTAGTFSMFSNLRTEGEHTNHLLLPRNLFKVFSYQDDLIEVVSVDQRIQGIYRRMPNVGQLIPRIEFARVMQKIRARGISGAGMTVRYRSEMVTTSDVANDPRFEFSVPWWQLKLFKFRAVNIAGPQPCSW